MLFPHLVLLCWGLLSCPPADFGPGTASGPVASVSWVPAAEARQNYVCVEVAPRHCCGTSPGWVSPLGMGVFPKEGWVTLKQEGIEEEQAGELCSGALAGWGLGPCWWWRLVEELPEPPAEVTAGEVRWGADLYTSVDVWTQHVGMRKERHPSGISTLGVCGGPRTTLGLFLAAVPFGLIGPLIPFNRGSGGDGHVGGIFMT